MSDVQEGIQKRLAEFIGVDERDLPTIRLLDPKAMKKYLYPSENLGNLTVDSLVQFIIEVRDGKIPPFMRSKEPP